MASVSHAGPWIRAISHEGCIDMANEWVMALEQRADTMDLTILFTVG